MIYNLKTIRKQVLGLGLSEGGVKMKGNGPKGEVQKHLEVRSKTAIYGYNVAVEYGHGEDLLTIAASISEEFAGFFYEGIGMGLFMLDRLSLFNKNRFLEFSQGPGKDYESIMYVGAGLITGFLHLPFQKFLDKANPFRGPAMIDGIGFHYAFFKTSKTLSKFFVPKKVKENPFYLERFDNGLGRALWFLFAGDIVKISEAIAKFPAARRASLWYGIGFVVTYARGLEDPQKIRLLKSMAGNNDIDLAQGALVGAHAKQNHTTHAKADTTLEQILIGKDPLDCHELAKGIINELPETKPSNTSQKHPWLIFKENIRNELVGETFA